MSIRNFTHNSNFIFTTNLFNDEQTSYGIQEVNLPGMSFSHIQVQRHSVLGNIQGDTITYNDLSLNIIVDEELNTWKEIVNKMQEMRNPDVSTAEKKEEMGYLEIQDDNTNKVLKLEFYGMIVESIDDLAYSTNGEDEIITMGVTIKYDYYQIVD